MLILSILLFFSLPIPIFAWVSDVWELVSHKNVDPNRRAFFINKIEMINVFEDYLAKVKASFLSRASYTDSQNREAIEYLKENVRWKNLTFIFCGQTVDQYTGTFPIIISLVPDKDVFYEMLNFESVQYIEVIDKKANYEFIKDPIDMLNLLMTFKLRSPMNFIMTQKMMINARDVSGITEEITWRVQRVDISGACVNTEKLDKSLITNTWEPKSKQTKVTARQFMDTVIDWIPFVDKFDEMKFHKNVHIASIGGRSWLTLDDFRSYMLAYTRRYSIRKDMKEDYEKHAETQIITEDVDHIVFQTSVFFEKLRHPFNEELWQFQIEAAYNTSSNEQWEVMNMFFRPTMNRVRQRNRDIETADDMLDDVMKEIEHVATTDDHSNSTIFGLTKRFKNTKLIENEMLRPMNGYGGTPRRLMILFRASMMTKFNRCERSSKFEVNGTFKDSVITCHYSTHRNIIVRKKTSLKIVGSHNPITGDVEVDHIEILDPTLVSEINNNGKTEARVNYVNKITTMMMGQSSMEYHNWEKNEEALMKYVNNDDFYFTLCGKSKRSEHFKKYLERRRRKFKLMEIDSMTIVQQWRTGMRFKMRFYSLNYMNYIVKEEYLFMIDVQDDLSKIRRVHISDSCVNTDQFEQDRVIPIESTRFREEGGVSAKQFMEIIKSSLPHIQNNGKINENNYSPKFEAIIETNFKSTDVYNLENFKEYMRLFTNYNKLREDYYEKNQDKKANTTIIAEELDHFVIKITMVFDHYVDEKNLEGHDEWVFVIEASYINEEKQWKIDKLVMTPPIRLLETSIIQKRASLAHMVDTVQHFKTILSPIARMPYVPAKIEADDCESKEFNSTSTDTGSFFKRFLGFFKAGNLTKPITTKNHDKGFNTESSDYKISYFYAIDGVDMSLDVTHQSNYNKQYNYYFDTKMTLYCPVIMESEKKRSVTNMF